MKTTGYLTIACVLGSCSVAKADDQRPNVVLIMADDLGWGDLHCYGAQDMCTPNIDRLAAEGMQFMNFHSNSTVSSPARAALMTGMFSDLAGVPGVIRNNRIHNFGYFQPRYQTLPEAFAESGYSTSLIGKWHLGDFSPNLPNDRGFEYFKGWLAGMMDSYTGHTRGGKNFLRFNGKTIKQKGHATDLFTEWAVDRIHQCEDDDRPMFMMVGYTAPHNPIEPRQDWLEKVQLREKDMSPKRAGLVALIEHMDDGVGQIMDALEETGKLDNTLVIFLSDNGGVLKDGASNGPLRGGKGDMWEGGIKVSCIAWQKGKIQPAQNDNLLMIMDLYPTMLTAAGAADQIPSGINGIDFSPVLYGAQIENPDRPLFWMRREGGAAMANAYYAVRIGDFKLMQNLPTEPLYFVNVAVDPQEKHPIPANKMEKKKRQRYFSTLQNHISEAGSIPWQLPAF